MIQRIQSVYLLLAAIAVALMTAFPIMSFYGDLHTFSVWLMKIENLVPDSDLPYTHMSTMPLSVFTGIVFLLSIFSILKYNNRKLQMKLIKVNVLLNIMLIIGIFLVYPRMITDAIAVTEEYKTAAFFPLVSLVLLILAFRGVKKDEELIKSADRLR